MDTVDLIPAQFLGFYQNFFNQFLFDNNVDNVIFVDSNVGTISVQSIATNNIFFTFNEFNPNPNEVNPFPFQVGFFDFSTGNSIDFEIEFRTGNALLDFPAPSASLEIPVDIESEDINGFLSPLTDFEDRIGSRENFVNSSNVDASTPGLWRFSFLNGTLPGQIPQNPLLPLITPSGFEFNDVLITNTEDTVWFDPEIAIGYNYFVDLGPNVSSVTIPLEVAGDDGVYDVILIDNQGNILTESSSFTIAPNETFSFIDNGFAQGVANFSIQGIDTGAKLDPFNPNAFVTGLNFVSEGIVNLRQEPIITNIEEDSLFTVSLNRFQNSNIPNTYLFAGETESANIRANFPNFNDEGVAFRVAQQPGDDLIKINRFQNTSLPNTYLYAGETESESIRANFPGFQEEGVAFYVYGVGSDKGTPFHRFRNTAVEGTYIFVGEEEKQGIMANFPVFEYEGIAFQAEV